MLGPSARRRILLAIREGQVDPRLLASARGLCQRLDADLEILIPTQGERLPDDLLPFLTSLRGEGVVYHLTQTSMPRRRDIVAYANGHACIATLIIDSLEGWESVAEDRGSNPWRHLACPLVTAVPGPTRRA